ncbi:sigma-70 family RNA polymerase sigma factor [Actinomadura sp. NPDC000600]|uniref:sigma-70 family RNA polymerase sigma factor n=1 Tax=Actinomadura sp. NPDC000600 TaxID=3154262 RepID=UPI00339665F9
MTRQDKLAADFEAHRPYLHAIAFRVLGQHADADDAVQEAWLRLARTGGDGIEELRGWLTTVTGRICLDILRRRGVRGEQPLEPELWTALGDLGPDPEAEAVLADSVGLALYVVMDALTPAERVSFVLHDVFEMPFDAVAAVLGRSTAAAKMLASRARGRIRLGAPTADAHSAARGVVDAFLAAAGRGDLAGLLTLLAPEVELHRGPSVVRGADEVAAQATVGARRDAKGHPALVDGVPGVLITMGGRPFLLMAFTVEDGRITTIRTLSDPKRLAQIVPSWVT